MMYVSQRLVTLSSFCIVCDEPHECGMDAMLKVSATFLKIVSALVGVWCHWVLFSQPAVCSKDLCIFSYQNMGITSDALECLETESEVNLFHPNWLSSIVECSPNSRAEMRHRFFFQVVDLLIVMAIIACQSQRANLIFDPYPVVFDPKDSKELALNPKVHILCQERALMLSSLIYDLFLHLEQRFWPCVEGIPKFANYDRDVDSGTWCSAWWTESPRHSLVPTSPVVSFSELDL